MNQTKTLICPKCGEKAIAVRDYGDGRKLYIHEQKLDEFGFVEVTKSCLVKYAA